MNDTQKKEDKKITIIVNGTEHTVLKEVLTFDEIVEIAFPGHPVDQNIVFSVVFEKAESKPHQGVLAKGGVVKVKKHTTFDVTQTNRS